MSSSRLFRKNAALICDAYHGNISTYPDCANPLMAMGDIYATHLPSSIMLSDVAPVFIKLFW